MRLRWKRKLSRFTKVYTMTPKLRTALTTNEKLYLFCGLIMVGLTTKGVAPLDVNQLLVMTIRRTTTVRSLLPESALS